MSKLHYTLADVDAILEDFAKSEYNSSDFSYPDSPYHLKSCVNYTESEKHGHWLRFRNDFIAQFKLNNPELFGYRWDEKSDDWVEDRSQGDFINDYV